MASRQGHLEAGKRRLEEFRRKKAEEKNKKAAASQNVQLQANSNLTDHSSAQTPQVSVPKPKEINYSNHMELEVPKTFDEKKLGNKNLGTRTEDLNHSVSGNMLENGTWKNGQVYEKTNEVTSNHLEIQRMPLRTVFAAESSFNSGNAGSLKREGKEEDEHSYGGLASNGVKIVSGSAKLQFASADFSSKALQNNEHAGDSIIVNNSLPSISSLYHSKDQLDHNKTATSTAGYKELAKGTAFLDSEPSNNKSNFKNSVFPIAESTSSTISEYSISSRRSRPSFLDSITPSLTSSAGQSRQLGLNTSQQKDELNSEENVSRAPDDRKENHIQGMNEKFVQQQLEISSQRNDDFAALEQHIEDLTQEKFALQRALDASRTLVESLAQENSSLTDAYNQQGAAVNQLKTDLERKQEEINAQLVVLNALKLESENAQNECSAADERAKMLASEVISLEEKALRLRSNELKLEKQLEKLQEELDSRRRHIHSMEKEHNDLQSTIEALQEERKVLQSKLRKASSVDNIDSTSSKMSKDVKDACTSTQDLVLDVPSGVSDDSRSQDTSPINETIGSEIWDGRISLTSLPVAVPEYQQRIVGNINNLIDELASEKEQLSRALTEEAAETAKLRASNQDLLQKLEAQTQRLELLTSQNMAYEGRFPEPVHYNSMHGQVEYVDEGDEVVERVMGWIMKLFPGGSSKRRTSKLL